MKKGTFLLFVIASALFTPLLAYQNNFMNLTSPTELGNLESEISFGHRFRGVVDKDPLDSFFGMQNGATVGLFFRQKLLYNTEAKIGYNFKDKEYDLDAGWKFTPADFPVQAQLGLQYFSQEKLNLNTYEFERVGNFLPNLAVQNLPFYDRIFINANLGYDLEDERLVTGLGLGVKVLSYLTVLGEYYPVPDRNSADNTLMIQDHDSFLMGLKFETYGHNFMFCLGNSDGINLRQLSKGATDRKLRFGFNVQRHLELF
jgi:hypothetical protein